jgi:hypothetical protein
VFDASQLKYSDDGWWCRLQDLNLEIMIPGGEDGPDQRCLAQAQQTLPHIAQLEKGAQSHLHHFFNDNGDPDCWIMAWIAFEKGATETITEFTIYFERPKDDAYGTYHAKFVLFGWDKPGGTNLPTQIGRSDH